MADPRRDDSGEIMRCETVSYLAFLELQAEDREQLRHQGFVARETRNGADYFKLRFRRQGRQVAIGLGRDPQFAERIGRELAQIQANRRFEREQARMIRATRGLLRRAKLELEPVLRNAGYGFYGYEIRKLREAKRLRQPARPAIRRPKGLS
jgi:hypothetical protein